jgi:hypothetical protein
MTTIGQRRPDGGVTGKKKTGAKKKYNLHITSIPNNKAKRGSVVRFLLSLSFS